MAGLRVLVIAVRMIAGGKRVFAFLLRFFSEPKRTFDFVGFNPAESRAGLAVFGKMSAEILLEFAMPVLLLSIMSATT